jgi:integrase
LEPYVQGVIQHDIINGLHDNSLDRYKKLLKSDKHLQPEKKLKQAASKKLGLAESLKKFLESTGRSMDKDLYYYTYRMVLNWGDRITCEMIPQKLMSMKYSSKTFNNRKLVLRIYCDWLVRNKVLEFNPLDDLPSRRKNSSKSSTRRRLTDTEVTQILDAIRNDKFVSPHSNRFKHSDYYPIFYFLASTGVRPAEAIGLQVSKINFSDDTIMIDQALARTRAGTSSSNRKMKGTKMEDWRELPIQGNQVLREMLAKLCIGKKPDELVFKSPTGLACDDRNMNDSVLKPVLKGLKIPHRVLYALRHSFISRCFERGMDIKTVQSLTGHKDLSVLLNIYAEVPDTKASIPVINTKHPVSCRGNKKII